MPKVRRLVLTLFGVAGLGLALVGAVALISVIVRHPLRSTVVMLIALVALLVVVVVVNRVSRRVRPGTVLELDLPSMPPEVADRNPLGALTGNQSLTLMETVAALERAARDKRVAGLVVNPRFSAAPVAAVQELRDAIVAFGAAGKFTIAATDTFAEGGPANASYLLATGCQEVVLHPGGQLGLMPLAREPNFYRGALDRVGIALQVFAREKYKSAAAQLVERGFTAADREQTQRLLDSLWEQVVDRVAEGRRLAPDQVRALADRGPLTAQEALDAGLVDRLVYTHEVLEGAKQRAGGPLLYLATYRKRAGRGRPGGRPVSVAVLHAVGEIRRAANPPIGITGGSVLSPETFVRRIRAVAKDRKVKAVVLRVDSPGGSAVASGALWAELNRVREAGKPLVISMGAVAGSGGYYIATPGDRIVAQPGTITGSIGVISLFPVVRELKDRMHVTTDQVYTGAEAPPFSVNRELTPGQRARVDVQIDAIYDAFLQRVAEGRHLAVEQVRGIAGGRVWTGADAVNVGLVDELGGLDRAMALAVELSGAPAGARAVPRKLPRRTLPLRRRASSSDDVGAAAATFSWRAALDVLPRGAVTHMGVDPRTFWLR